MTAAGLNAAVETLCSTYYFVNGWFAARPSSWPASVIQFLPRRRGTQINGAHAAGDGLEGDVRPGGRRLRAYWLMPSGWCPTSRRCSTTTRCWPAPTCTAGRCSATSCFATSSRRPSIGRCATRAPEAAHSALDADSEGVEGKFYVLVGRGDASRAEGGPEAGEAIAWSGPASPGTSRARTSRCAARAGPNRSREWRRRLDRGAGEARLARARAPDRRDAGNDLRGWPRPAPCSAPRIRGGGGRLCAVRRRLAARLRGAAAAHLEGRRGQAQRRLPGGHQRLPAQGADPPCTRPASIRAGPPGRVPGPTP